MGTAHRLGVVGFAHMHVNTLMENFGALPNIRWVACADTLPDVPELVEVTNSRAWNLRYARETIGIPVSAAVTALSLGLSIPAAYGLTRLRTRGGKTILVTIVSSQFFPPMIFFLPFYILFYFLGQHQIDYGRLMAGAVLLSLPIVVPFAGLQRYFRQGRMEGGVKG